MVDFNLLRAGLTVANRTLASSVSNPTIVRLVVGAGDDQKVSCAHKDLLCHYSDYFRSMLNGPYTEAQTKEVSWEDEDPAIVQIMVSWLYTQEVIVVSKHCRLDPAFVATLDEQADKSLRIPRDKANLAHLRKTASTYLVLYKLWVIADKRGTESLRIRSIKVIHQLTLATPDRVFPTRSDIWAWENSSIGSGLRKIISDSGAVNRNLLDFNSSGHHLPTALCTSIVRRMKRLNGDPAANDWVSFWRGLDLCQYDDHPTGGVNCGGEQTKWMARHKWVVRRWELSMETIEEREEVLKS